MSLKDSNNRDIERQSSTTLNAKNTDRNAEPRPDYSTTCLLYPIRFDLPDKIRLKPTQVKDQRFQDLKGNKDQLTTLQENQDADYLVNLIRASMTDKLKEFLSEIHGNAAEILQTTFQLEVEFRKKLSQEAKASEKGIEYVKMVLSPIHIAIILKLSKVVDEIGRFINRLPKPTAILQNVFEQKVSLPEFVNGQKTYYKNGLQGMNAFYLASKYSSNCLQALFDIQNRKNLIGFDFTPFLKETNEYLRQTPLHMAVQKRTSKATRYKIK